MYSIYIYIYFGLKFHQAEGIWQQRPTAAASHFALPPPLRPLFIDGLSPSSSGYETLHRRLEPFNDRLRDRAKSLLGGFGRGAAIPSHVLIDWQIVKIEFQAPLLLLCCTLSFSVVS